MRSLQEIDVPESWGNALQAKRYPRKSGAKTGLLGPVSSSLRVWYKRKRLTPDALARQRRNVDGYQRTDRLRCVAATGQ